MAFPFGVEVVEDGIDDTVAALGVLKVAHHLQPSSDLPETSFNDVGGTDHLT